MCIEALRFGTACYGSLRKWMLSCQNGTSKGGVVAFLVDQVTDTLHTDRGRTGQNGMYEQLVRLLADREWLLERHASAVSRMLNAR